MIRSLASADKGRCRDMTIQATNSTGSRSRKAAGGLESGAPSLCRDADGCFFVVVRVEPDNEKMGA